jgi:hypothetical protein
MVDERLGDVLDIYAWEEGKPSMSDIVALDVAISDGSVQ